MIKAKLGDLLYVTAEMAAWWTETVRVTERGIALLEQSEGRRLDLCEECGQPDCPWWHQRRAHDLAQRGMKGEACPYDGRLPWDIYPDESV